MDADGQGLKDSMSFMHVLYLRHAMVPRMVAHAT